MLSSQLRSLLGRAATRTASGSSGRRCSTRVTAWLRTDSSSSSAREVRSQGCRGERRRSTSSLQRRKQIEFERRKNEPVIDLSAD